MAAGSSSGREPASRSPRDGASRDGGRGGLRENDIKVMFFVIALEHFNPFVATFL